MSHAVKIAKEIEKSIFKVVKTVWDELTVPMLEQVFALIGIVDETVVTAQRISSPIFSTYDGDAVHDATVKAVITKVKSGTDFFPTYMEEMYQAKAKVRSYYNYANGGSYVHGLPTMTVSGIKMTSDQLATIDSAIESSVGFPITTTYTHSGYITTEQHFIGLLQNSHDYLPYANTLTKEDKYGVLRDDWILNGNYLFDTSISAYEIDISRSAALAVFWVEGPNVVKETDTAVFTVTTNREVPAGKSSAVELLYSFTKKDGTAYSYTGTVTIPELSKYVDVPLTISVADSITSILVKIVSIANTGGVFEDVEISSDNTVVCSVTALVEEEVYTPQTVEGSLTVFYQATNETLRDVILGDNFTPERHLTVKYHRAGGSPSEWFYWFYNHNDGTYDIEPQSESLHDLEMLPVVILRKDGQFVNTDKSSQTYLTTKRIMEFLSFDVDQFIDNIASSPGADVDSISDAYVHFSMMPANTDPTVSKLLYHSFYNIIVTNGLYSELEEYNAIFKEGDVNNSIVWTKHTYDQNIEGSVTTVGEYNHYVQKTVEGSILYLRYQKSSGLYDMLSVYNLNTLTSIEYNGYHQVATASLWNKDTNSVDESFGIALSWLVFSKLTAQEQTGVYKWVCRMDLYSLTVTELRWYETSAFADLFQIVMIILAVVTFGQTLVLYGIIAAATQLLISYAIGELIVFVAEKTGSAVLAAVVGFIATVLTSGKSGTSFFDMVNAIDLTDQVRLFADNFIAGQSAIDAKTIEELVEDGMEINAAREQWEADEEARAKAEYDSPITIEFLQGLKTLETQISSAIESQYRFEDTFGYGKVGNYHEALLRTEIT